MERFADYFAVAGFKRTESGDEAPSILQRFPSSEWKDVAFPQGIELFCQPLGWKVSDMPCPPKFFTSVLTDVEGQRAYCACLSFSESVKSQSGDADEIQHKTEYQPKTICIVARHPFLNLLKACLCLVYSQLVQCSVSNPPESLVGRILSFGLAPMNGSGVVKYGLGCGEVLELRQLDKRNNLPYTGTAVAQVFRILGLQNTVLLFCATVTENRILFHSDSFSLLSMIANALLALLFPLTMSYPFIPILPASLVEFLSAPTPFIMGIHSSYLPCGQDLNEVVVVDIDGGTVLVPDSVVVPELPKFLSKSFYRMLLKIFNPGLLTADIAFTLPHQQPNMSEQEKDKAARALFLKLFAELFRGYRSFLTVGRMYPEPFIEFSKDKFISAKGLADDEFMTKLVHSLAFSLFISERGIPFRQCDIFDDLVAQGIFFDSSHGEPEMADDLLQLARSLDEQEPVEIVNMPQSIGTIASAGAIAFRDLDGSRIEEILEKRQLSSRSHVENSGVVFRTVPESPVESKIVNRHISPDVPSREVSQLKNCIEALLRNKMAEATKYLPGVCRSMKSGTVRRLFVECLLDGVSSDRSSSDSVQSHKAVLTNAQFDVMVQLMNAALRNDSGAGSVNTAASLLPLTTVYCRELSPGVCQFVYMCVQDHVIWENTHFWSQAFYEAVQCELYELYANSMDDNHGHGPGNETPRHQTRRSSSIVDTSSEGIGRDFHAVSSSTVLKLLAKQMQVWPTLSAELQTEWSSYEEATVYGQCVLFASRMVWLLTPFHSTDGEEMQTCEYDEDTAMIGRRENTSPWEQNEIVRFVLRVFSSICLETHLSQERVTVLRKLVTGMVDLHLDSLQQIQDECSRLQPLQQVKTMRPVMLDGESVVTDGMRSYLLPDGREVGLSFSGMNGPKFLPAEGAVYVTTYRVIFLGLPCDSNAGDAPVTRSLPVSAIIQIKKLAPVYLSAKLRWLQDVFQIRSATFELMKIGFDDQDVSNSSIDLFANFLKRLRNPSSVITTFAFIGVSGTDWKRAAVAGGGHQMEVEDTSSFVKKLARRGAIHKDKEFRKESMMGTLQKAFAVAPARPPRESDSTRRKKKAIRSLRAMSYPCDFERVGLGKLTESDSDRVDELWRVTVVNIKYEVCRSYPAVVCVPAEVTDSQLHRLSGQYNQSRWPVATWRHPRTGTVLLRSSSFVASNVVAKLKGGLAQLGSSFEVPRKLTPLALPSIGLQSQEVHSYLAAIAGATPKLRRYIDKFLFEDDINRIFPDLQQVHGDQGDQDQQKRHSTFFVDLSGDPEMESAEENQQMSEIKKQALEAAFTGSLDCTMMKRPDGASSALSTVIAASVSAQNQREILGTNNQSGVTETTVEGGQSAAIDLLSSLQQKTAAQSQFKRMYIIGERQHLKNAKEDSFPFCEFIPVDIPSVGALRQSHKKLIRACAPSDSHADPDTFFSAVQDSGWLDNVRTIIQLAGAVVDLLDVQRASVIVSFDSGWDSTCQVVSLAQLLLDPYYRTRKGFQVLIEKEWLAFGHRFSQRNNQTTASSLNDFSPVFLLFLDAVHQVVLQFPLAFEFNVHYIETLAYHQSSMRFSTFLLNSEKERYEEGWLPHSWQRLDGHSNQTTAKLKTGKCFWSHVEKLDSESPVFYNVRYKADKDNPVLRPYGNVSSLRVWSYFTRADIHSSLVSYERTAKAARLKTGNRLTASPAATRRRQGSIVSSASESMRSVSLGLSSALGGDHGDMSLVLIDDISRLFKQCSLLATALQRNWPCWRSIWDEMRLPLEEATAPMEQFPVRLVSHGLTAHKRTSIEVLLKGKLSGNAEHAFSHPHRFTLHTYVTPTYCNYCRQVLWGLVRQGFRCVDCGYNCHEKCRPLVPKNCHEVINFDIRESGAAASADGDDSDMGPEARERLGSQSVFYGTKQGQTAQHEGFLYKKGDVRKKWKYWWCVLDIEHQELKYYEALRESQCRGTILVSECTEALELDSAPGAPRVDGTDGYCFELDHPKRHYLFMAKTAVSRETWLQKLNLCVSRR